MVFATRHALLAALAACGTTPSPTDAGPPDAQAECSGPQPQCCASYCDNDVVGKVVCTNGAWVCNGVTPADCPCGTDHFCLLPEPPICGACDGGLFHEQCNAEAGAYECPAGTVNTLTTDASCAGD